MTVDFYIGPKTAAGPEVCGNIKALRVSLDAVCVYGYVIDTTVAP